MQDEAITTLLPISKETIGNSAVNTIDGRKLHAFLGIKKDYSDWIKVQIKRAHLVENEDFVVLPQKGENLSGGRPSLEYHLTLEAGKHISMMSGANKGKEVRDYFIECEKRALQPQPVPQVSDARTAALIDMLVKQDALEQAQRKQASELEAVKQAVAIVEARTQPENEYFTVAGYARLKGLTVDLNAASGLGKRCATLSKKEGKPIGQTRDPRWGIVNTYHESILQAVINH